MGIAARPPSSRRSSAAPPRYPVPRAHLAALGRDRARAGRGLLLAAPSTLLQLGLRDSTEPWFFTNDSTYQIEQSGELVLHGDNPYGHDYRRSGPRALLHPRRHALQAGARARGGTPAFRLLPRRAAHRGGLAACSPSPFDDYRLLVLLCHARGLAAALAFRAPLGWRLALGAVLVCNPVAVRCAWFGQNDPTSLVLLVLAFALVTHVALRLGGGEPRRRRAAQAVRARRAPVPRAHAVAGADRGAAKRAALVFAGVLARGGAAVPDRRPGRLLRRHGRTAPAPTGSWATGCRRSSSASACSTTARAAIRSRCWRC